MAHARLDERDIDDLITAYCQGATGACFAVDYSLSLDNAERLLHIAGVRQTPAAQRAAKGNAGCDAVQ